MPRDTTLCLYKTLLSQLLILLLIYVLTLIIYFTLIMSACWATSYICFFFFFQAEDGIRDLTVTGVQTCALPIWLATRGSGTSPSGPRTIRTTMPRTPGRACITWPSSACRPRRKGSSWARTRAEIGRASCRERV